MKRFTAIPAALLLFCVTHMQAQTTSSALRQQALQYNKHLMSIIEHNQQVKLDAANGGTARTTNASERLIAIMSEGMSEEDSSRYVYSGIRSSSFDFNDMIYAAGFNSTDAGFPISTGDLAAKPAISCDSFIIYGFDASSWHTDQIAVSVYDDNNNLLEYSDADGRTFYTYDANGRIIASTILAPVGNYIYDSSQKRSVVYNGNKVTNDSSSKYENNAWLSLSKWTYAYNNAGNLTQATHYNDSLGIADQMYILSYNADNTIQKDSIAVLIDGIWMPYITDSVGYTTGVNFITYEAQTSYDLTTGLLTGTIEHIKHVTAGLPDTMYTYAIYENDTAFPSKIAYVYDSYNNPINSYGYTTNPGSSSSWSTTPNSSTHYYYQIFNTAVNNIAKQNIDIKIYPNPAKNEITISQTGIQQGALTHIALINALGQTVETESLPWMNNTETLSVSGLKPGNYWIIIQDKNANVQ